MCSHFVHGLALDIDDTICATFPHFVHKVNEKWGNPLGFDDEEIIKRYKRMPDVPFWQVAEIQEWLKEQSHSNSAQEEIAAVPGASEAVSKISIYAPIKFYITSRTTDVRLGTRHWLKNNGFPEAKLITRPGEFEKMNGNIWKAEIIEKKFPQIFGIIDDNPEIISALSENYRGIVYLYGTHHGLPDFIKTNIKIRLCSTWNDVVREVKKDTRKMLDRMPQL